MCGPRRSKTRVGNRTMRALIHVWCIKRTDSCFFYRILKNWYAWLISSLCVSELTAGLSITPARQLCLTDVEILAGSPPPAIRLRIKASKTDPLAVGCFVYVGRSSRTVCPVQAVLAYLAHRDASTQVSDPGPFFRWLPSDAGAG